MPRLPPPNSASGAAGCATLKLVAPATTMDAAVGYAGVDVSPVDDAVEKLLAPDAWASARGERNVLVTIRGLTKADVDATLYAILRRVEAGKMAAAGSDTDQLRLGVLIPPGVATSLLNDRAAQLKAFCRRSVSRLQVTIEPGAVDEAGERILSFLGLPEALHVALPEVNGLVQADLAKTGELEKKPPKVPALPQGVAVSPLPATARCLPGPPTGNTDELLDWLLSLDGGHGALLIYHKKLAENFDAVSELSLVDRGPNGECPDPQFFEDIGVANENHREFFRHWFRNRS